MTNRMDEDGLAAMAVDCNLKQWQLLKVMKYVKFATGCRLSNVTMKQMNDKFASDMVIPETGEYEHETTNDKGTNVTESVTYDYQSAVEVFKYVTAQLLMENNACATRVKRICVGFGGDHGKGAFRLTMRVLIRLNSGEVLKDDIGTSTVFCKTDSVDVLRHTILERLTAELKHINESVVVLNSDGDFVDCDLQPRASIQETPTTFDMHNAIYILGDLKWLALAMKMSKDISTECTKQGRENNTKNERNQLQWQSHLLFIAQPLPC